MWLQLPNGNTYCISPCMGISIWMETSRVALKHKRGARVDLSNYRHISVISVVSKIIKKVIFDQLYEYLSTHHFLFIIK